VGVGGIPFVPGIVTGMPEMRLQADYIVVVWKNLEMGAHIVYDEDYGLVDGGTGTEHTTGLVSAAATFT